MTAFERDVSLAPAWNIHAACIAISCRADLAELPDVRLISDDRVNRLSNDFDFFALTLESGFELRLVCDTSKLVREVSVRWVAAQRPARQISQRGQARSIPIFSRGLDHALIIAQLFFCCQRKIYSKGAASGSLSSGSTA